MTATQTNVPGRYSHVEWRLSESGILAPSFTLSAGPLAAAPAGLRIHRVAAYRGFRLRLFARGQEGDTFDFRLWGVTLPRKGASLDLALVGAGSATLGAKTGVSADGAVVRADERLADTLTWSLASDQTDPKGVGAAAMEAYGLGEPQVYSPQDDTEAWLIVPHWPWNAVLLEPAGDVDAMNGGITLTG